MRQSNPFFVAVSLAALVSLAAFPAAAGSADAGTRPAFETEGPGNASYALKIENRATGFVVDVTGFGPATSQEVSIGVQLFDADRTPGMGIVAVGHTSTNRWIVVPVAAPGGTDAAAEVPAGVDVRFASAGSADGRCPFACSSIGMGDAPPGTYFFIVWIGGASASALSVSGDDVAVTVAPGAAYVVGDAEIANGDPNVQVQRSTPALGGAGAKLMRDATASVRVEKRLWGVWGDSDFKLACVGFVGCAWRSSATGACASATGVACDPTRLSWQGPGGGGAGFLTYGFVGGAPGDYAFRVDQKVDAYTVEGAGVAEVGTFVVLNEDHSYLSVADNELPL